MGLKFYVGEMQAQANENARMSQEVAKGQAPYRQLSTNFFLLRCQDERMIQRNGILA